MKAWTMVFWVCQLGFLSLVLQACCERPVTCQWAPFGDWSECDGCTKTQVRTRPVQVYAQFGGMPCSGEPVQWQSCNGRGCPLEEGCGERFRCSSGQCISSTLVCNGDQDCEEDGSDEQNCEESTATRVCDMERVPPNAELTGRGFDILTGLLRGSVINTKSFGGQCRKVFSGDLRSFYRLPRSLISYTFQVRTDNDFSDEFYSSYWSYVKDINKRSELNQGHHYETFHDEELKTKAHRMMVIKNQVEVAQFQNSPPEYLTLSDEFWKALASLPTTYIYPAYRKLIDDYGTHFLSEGSLGGRYQALLYLDAETINKMSSSSTDFHECIMKTRRILFIKWSTTKCKSIVNAFKQVNGFDKADKFTLSPITGGSPAFIAGLSVLNLEDPEANWNMYTKWAGSVKDFPTVINQKLRPLHELVKEVPCAGIKKLHLKRALEEYQTQKDPCHCQPCHNNGQPLLRGTVCSCVCKPGTSGSACEHGTSVEDGPGVIHGDWTCWSAWSSCSQGRRSRSRTCSNPHPNMGGKACNGLPVEHTACEDEDFEHLRTMEPHCFDSSLSPTKSCKNPPHLRNGFVLAPHNIYPVGSKIVYACIEGYHLIGDAVAECGEDLMWIRSKQECQSTVCGPPQLLQNVIGSPWKLTYEIGEMITLSCSPGKQLEGNSEILCDSSLNWSPQETARCSTLPTEAARTVVQCEPWEKLAKDKCVCKMPYECKSSLEVCAWNQRGSADRLTICKMQALKCLGREYALAEDSACTWPTPKSVSCPGCQMWERCDERTNLCVCREPGSCAETGSLICARTGEGAPAMTMTECEAGLRSCRKETLIVVSLQKCDS
ncbi:complement component C7 [Brienomyrus brachyistius]|uniref:complement component C7 n=1 Tax=Brienomyrus brachyistius TaxID=42636 RepID=UPI0020B2AC6A|nr:complement component C7 [Brienomyrus brachyistius]